MSEYLDRIVENLKSIENDEAEALARATEAVANTIKNDGLIFVFGCGHSHIPGLDAFYRAGGLANVSPMLDTDLMLHNQHVAAGLGVALLSFLLDQQMPGNVLAFVLIVEVEQFVALIVNKVLDDTRQLGFFRLFFFLRCFSSSRLIANGSCGTVTIQSPLGSRSISRTVAHPMMP